MASFELKLEGKIYTIDWSKFTIEQLNRLEKLTRQFAEYGNFNFAYEALELITGIEKEKLLGLKSGVINRILAIIKKEGEKGIKKPLYFMEELTKMTKKYSH